MNKTQYDYVKLFMAYEERRSDNTAHFRKILELQKQVDELKIQKNDFKESSIIYLEIAQKLQKQIADYEKALDLVMKNLRYYPGNQNPQGDAEVDAAYNNAEAILAKYRGQNGM